jgi:outer membrane protein W
MMYYIGVGREYISIYAAPFMGNGEEKTTAPLFFVGQPIFLNGWATQHDAGVTIHLGEDTKLNMSLREAIKLKNTIDMVVKKVNNARMAIK